jgi:spermidine synthase
LTGFSGLVYEVAWQRACTILLASHATAIAVAWTVFFGMLGVGYALFGRLTRKIAERATSTGGAPRLLRVYALTQIGVGAYALFFPSLFGFIQFLSKHAPGAATGFGFTVDLVLAVVSIGPLAMLLSATIPILTLALAGSRENATRVHAWVYGFSTAGAAAGVVAGVFCLIPGLGLAKTFYAMGSVNLVAGVLFMVLDRFGERVWPEFEPAEDASAISRESFGPYAIVCVLTGFGMVGLQCVLGRISLLALGPTDYSWAIVMAVFFLGTALGSLAISVFRAIPRGVIVGSQWALVAYLFMFYHEIENAPYWAHALRALFRNVEEAFLPFYIASFACAFLVLALPVGLAGALLPLLFHHLRGKTAELGSVAGRLFSWNAVGSLLGALLGGYLLLFWLDLHHVYRIVMAALVAEAVLLTILIFRVPLWSTAAFVALPIFIGLLILPTWSPERLVSGSFHVREPIATTFKGPDAYFEAASSENPLIYFHDGPAATISVREGAVKRGRPNRTLFNNGESEGSLDSDYPTMALAALVPALLAENPERAFVMGLATGVTASELASLQSISGVEVVEDSWGVLDVAPLFNKGNMNAAANPKITITRGDPFRAITRSNQSYDVISSTISNPWIASAERLYTVEFFEAVRDHLTPGGVYAQWLQLDRLNSEALRVVLRTYDSVFPQSSIWYSFGNHVLLLGFNDSKHALDVAAIKKRLRQPDFRAGLERVGIRKRAAFFAHELLPLGVLHAAQLDASLHTLQHPVLADIAARSFHQGDRGAFPKLPTLKSTRVGRENSLLRLYAGRGDQPMPRGIVVAAAQETCKRGRIVECATLLMRWSGKSKTSDKRATLLARLQREPRNRELLKEGSLASLDLLLGNQRLPQVYGRKSLEFANRISKTYLRYYHHAVPFDRSVLSAAWSACKVSGCKAGRRHVEQLVGKLESPKDGQQRRRKITRRK